MGEGEELIRETWGRWNSGVRRLEPETFDPEIEIHSALAGDVFKGEAGLQKWMAEIDEQFVAWEIEIESLREPTPDRFLAHGTIRARGRQSGVDLDQPASWVIELRDGRLRRIRNFIGSGADQAAEAEAA